MNWLFLKSEQNQLKKNQCIEMKYLKRFENVSKQIDIEKLSKHYTSEKIDICEDIIQNIKDILIDLKDSSIEIFTYVDYTPYTWILKNENPEIFVDIQVKDSDMIDEKVKSEVEEAYNHILNYLNSSNEDIEIEEFLTDRKSSVRRDSGSYVFLGLSKILKHIRIKIK